MKNIYAAFLLIPFLIFTIYVIYQDGYLSVYTNSFSTLPTIQVLYDLGIALLLINIWVVKQIIELQMQKFWIAFYLILGVALGVIGPLVFLLHRNKYV